MGLYRKALPHEMTVIGDRPAEGMIRVAGLDYSVLTNRPGVNEGEQVLTVQPVKRSGDRHRPGYMAAYMRRRRAKEKDGSA